VALKAALAQKEAVIIGMQNDFKAMKAGLDEMKKTILGEGDKTHQQTTTGKTEYKGKTFSAEAMAAIKNLGTQLQSKN
jgi:hypothetical protein